MQKQNLAPTFKKETNSIIFINIFSQVGVLMLIGLGDDRRLHAQQGRLGLGPLRQPVEMPGRASQSFFVVRKFMPQLRDTLDVHLKKYISTALNV